MPGVDSICQCLDFFQYLFMYFMILCQEITWIDHLHSSKCKSGIELHIYHTGLLFQVPDIICLILDRKLGFSI